MLHYGSSINNASSYALVAIRRTPTSQWSENVRIASRRRNFVSTKFFTRFQFLRQLKRLSDMIQTEDISLSGSKFFFITRQMILMVGFAFIATRTAWNLFDGLCEGFLCCRRNTLCWETFKMRIVERVSVSSEMTSRPSGLRLRNS